MMIDTITQNIRFGMRVLTKRKLFAFVAIATLGLGIGVNTAIFSVVNAVLLAPLPYGKVEELVAISRTTLPTRNDQLPESAPNLQDLKEQNQVFEQIAAFRPQPFILTGGDQPERASGKIVIAPQFRAVWFFSEGLAQVWIGDRSGYIDKSGKMVIDPQFTGFSPFSDGLAGVFLGDSESGVWGYIDKTGNFVILPRFRSGGQFSQGLAHVSEVGTRGYIDKDGEFVTKLPDDLVGGSFSEGLTRVRWQDGSSGFIDKSGNVIVKRERGVDVVSDFAEGLAVIRGFKDNRQTCGYIDRTGKIIIEPLYQMAMPFSDGLAAVCFARSRVPDQTCGYIDKTGQVVIPFGFDGARPFHNGLALVIAGDNNHQTWGYIDKTSRYVWNPTK